VLDLFLDTIPVSLCKDAAKTHGPGQCKDAAEAHGPGQLASGTTHTAVSLQSQLGRVLTEEEFLDTMVWQDPLQCLPAALQADAVCERV